MNKKPKPDRKMKKPLPKKRPTIAFLTDIGAGPYPTELARAAEAFTREQDVNLLSFSGKMVADPNAYWSQANAVYDLVDPENVDALVVASGMLGTFLGAEELKTFFEHFSMPVVSLGIEVTGVPSVLLDNYAGMKAAVEHLVQAHGCRRIIFIKGPEGHPEASERYQAYVDVLAGHNIPVEPELVLAGDFREVTGREMMASLLDAKGLIFNAVVAANDEMALGALETLEKRNIRVPYDVAVVGFDNIRRCDFVMPPLTTVQQPTRAMMVEGIKLLLAQLAGETVPERVTLPTDLVLRQSCGCQTSTVLEAALGPVAIEKTDFSSQEEALEIVVFQRREEILSQIRQVVGDVKGLSQNWAERLLDAFWAALTTASSDEALDDFLPVLNATLREVVVGGNDIRVWQGVISVLRRQIRPYLQGKELFQAEDIWQQARVVVGEIAHWLPSYESQQANHRGQLLRDMSTSLISAFDTDELLDSLAYFLPRLEIGRCYLSLYQDPQNRMSTSKLIFAFDERGRMALEPGGYTFPTRQLVPPDVMPRDKRYGLLVAPLFFKEEQLGFLLFEEGQPEVVVYEVLRGEISSALQGALLVKRHEEAEQAMSKHVSELELLAQVSATTSTILDTSDLLQQVVDLTKERFDLYHVHIYLLDEPGDTLELAAGTGNPGQEMLAEKWHIPLMQKQSLVARAARTRQGMIVDNVQEEPDWLPNPLLPDTRSELAVPLIVGDKVLGVFDVQSEKIGRFTEQDVRIQTMLAAHVAVTLQNSRLFTEMAQRTTELEALSQVSQQLTTVLDPKQLVADVVEQIGAAFNYYYTQIYLFDQAQENLVLAGGTGEVGQALLARQHSLPQGRGLVGRAAEQNKSIVVPNVQRHIGAEIITATNLEEVYRRELDPVVETEWYAAHIARHFGDVELLKDWTAIYPNPSGKVLKLGYVALTPGPFSGMLQRGVAAAARDLQVEVDFVIPPREGENLPLFEAMLEQKVDGLIVIPDGLHWAEPIEKGLAAGIPVVTANRSFKNSPALMHAGLDDFTAGVLLAQQLVNLLQAENRFTGKILVGIRNPDRTAGVKHGLRHTNYTLVEIQGYAKEKEALENLWEQGLNHHADPVAVMGLSATEMPTLVQIKRRRQGQWLLVGFDLEAITLDGLRDGTVQITIGQHPYLQGYLPVLALVEHLRQGKPLSGWMAEGWLPNALLPETKAEAAVPIISGDQTLGVLDVQHNIAGSLRAEKTNLLRSVAGQVAIALTNARLFAETQVTLSETANLYQASRRINEANNLNETMASIAETSENRDVNGILLAIFEQNATGQVDSLSVAATWFSGQGMPPPAEGARLPLDTIPYKNLLFNLGPVFIDDVLHDERLDFEALAAIQQSRIQSLAILPLWVGNRQIGALLLRAETRHNFTQSEQRLYTSLARQVAVAVENQQLLAETQSVLAELEATQRRYAIQAWESYRTRSSTLYYEQVRESVLALTESLSPNQNVSPLSLPANGQDSLSPAGDPVPDETPSQVLPAEQKQELVVPLKVRGEEIGVLGIVETGQQRVWSPEEIALVQAIAEQVSQAAENLRLIDETQQAAAREVRVNEIGDKIQSAQSLEEALRVAVREVGLTLKVPQTAVQLKVRNQIGGYSAGGE